VVLAKVRDSPVKRLARGVRYRLLLRFRDKQTFFMDKLHALRFQILSK
jgi:hypothetical protein